MVGRMGIVSAFYLPHLGGVEQFTASLAHELVGMGIETSVITCNVDDMQPYERVKPGLEVYRLPCRPLAGGRFPALRSGSALREVTEQLCAAPFDGMLVNTRFFSTTPYALRLAKSMGIRAVVLDHGSSYIGFGNPAVDWAVRAYEHGMTFVAKRYDPDFYGVSAMSATWLEHFGIQAKGCIHNAIDVAEFDATSSGRDFRSEFGLRQDQLLVAFTGRMLAAKGVWHVLETARLVASSCDACFVMAGDGPERDAVSQHAPANVRFVGKLDRADVSALLHQSDLFLFPSEYPEGMPTSVLEACACGVATLGTNVGGMRELLPDDSYGRVYETADPQEFARQICWYYTHEDELKSCGQRCREHVLREFSWHATAQATIGACEAAQRKR